MRETTYSMNQQDILKTITHYKTHRLVKHIDTIISFNNIGLIVVQYVDNCIAMITCELKFSIYDLLHFRNFL